MISGHMTVTSGNVSHPEDEAMGSFILVSSEDLEADQIKTTPLGSSKGNMMFGGENVHFPIDIHRVTKSCVPGQAHITDL